MLSGFSPWPPELAERYRAAGYWRDWPLGRLTRSGPGRERTALVTPQARFSHAQLDTAADELAFGLQRLGIKPQDRVVLQLPNSAAFVIVTLALFRVGALPVFAVPGYRSREIAFLFEHTAATAYVIPDVWQRCDYRQLARAVRTQAGGPRHVLVDGDAEEFRSLESIREASGTLPEVDSSEPAFLLPTGGTTGMPKLIPRTHNDYEYQLRAAAAAVRFDSDSVYLAALPAAHNAALGCPGVLGSLLIGAKCVLAPNPSPELAFELIEREGVTLTTLMPQIVALWLDAAQDCGARFPSLTVQVGGAMLAPEVARQVRSVLGATLTHWFGMSEGFLSCTALDDPEEIACTTQGRPICAADELRVVDPADHEVGRDCVGELLVRGPCTLRGYYNAPAHNREVFTAEGFLRTGDLVRISPAGNMVVVGRNKDIINRAGEKISTSELELELAAHPQIKRAAVIPLPDPSLGEKTCAVIVADESVPTLAAVRAFLRERGIADFKLPDRLETVDTLPLTSLGKIDKTALRAAVQLRAIATEAIAAF